MRDEEEKITSPWKREMKRKEWLSRETVTFGAFKGF